MSQAADRRPRDAQANARWTATCHTATVNPIAAVATAVPRYPPAATRPRRAGSFTKCPPASLHTPVKLVGHPGGQPVIARRQPWDRARQEQSRGCVAAKGFRVSTAAVSPGTHRVYRRLLVHPGDSPVAHHVHELVPARGALTDAARWAERRSRCASSARFTASCETSTTGRAPRKSNCCTTTTDARYNTRSAGSTPGARSTLPQVPISSSRVFPAH